LALWPDEVEGDNVCKAPSVEVIDVEDRVEPASGSRRVRTPLGAAGIPVWLASWWQCNRVAVTHALVVVVCLRVALGLIIALSAAYLPQQQGLHYVYQGSGNVWLAGWARWDSEWYLDIAQYGYLARDELIAFYPLYPALVSIFAPLFGHDYVLSGVVVSTLAAFTAFFYLFKLVTEEFGEEMAGRTVLYTAIFPMSFFLLAVYSESLFLAVTVAAFYHARRGQWVFAGLAAFLAALTRSNGVLLVFPLAYEAWQQSGGSFRGVLASLPRPAFDRVFGVIAAPIGALAWMLYLWSLVHDPLAYVHREAQFPWWRVLSLPWNTLVSGVQDVERSGLAPLMRAVNATNLAAGLLLIVASILAWRRLPRAYALYLAMTTMLLFSSVPATWPLESMPRFLVVIFPCFMLLAQLGSNQRWDRAIVMISALLLGLFTALFSLSYWVF